MALPKEDNELLTRTGPGTPMGKMLRQYWVPVIRSSALEADGAPLKVRLFGQDFVAFRVTDGTPGLIDEACPHRGVSMALARNEENGLRCIFHGWKLEASGKVVDAPCEPAARRERFCASIRSSQYAVRETSGVLWAYVGEGEAPRFPDFEFADLPPERVCFRRAVVPYNYLQGIEAHVDSSHVGFLHSGFLTVNAGVLEPNTRANLSRMMVDNAPRFEMQDTPYGLRESALRDVGDGTTYARIREVVLPFYTFIPGPQNGPYSGRISVPIDDETSAEWYLVYDPDKTLDTERVRTLFHNVSDDPDNFAANMGDPSDLWGQDREAMKKGHFSGLTKNLSFEDFIVQASMGARVDRSKEQLGSADLIIATVRRKLLDGVRKVMDGQPAPWRDGFDYKTVRSQSVEYGSGKSWKDFITTAHAAE
jgi:phenylpropionate dioxygenase-like ring-hydroxylating dioxygenase large terminal subunit